MFHVQDELAESAIPDPGYGGVNDELAMETFDFDVFDYWMDTEYGSDSYWDSNMDHLAGMREEKRKRVLEQSRAVGKRRVEVENQLPNVVFRPLGERMRRVLYKEETEGDDGKRESFALLPDWRERFKGREEPEVVRKMPEEMRRAAMAGDEQSPPRKKGKKKAVAVRGVEAEEDWEDEDVDMDGADDEEGEGGIDLDPEMLKTVLKQRLGEAGLDGLDEATFMQSIAKMLSGDGVGTDDAAGELAQSLLGRASDDQAVSGWLSEQGVSLGAQDEDDRASAPEGEPPPQDGAEHQESQPDLATLTDSAAAPSSPAEKARVTVRQMSAVMIPAASTPTSSKVPPASAIVGAGVGRTKRRNTVTFEDGEQFPNGPAADVELSGDKEVSPDPTKADAVEEPAEPAAKQPRETTASRPSPKRPSAAKTKTAPPKKPASNPTRTTRANPTPTTMKPASTQEANTTKSSTKTDTKPRFASSTTTTPPTSKAAPSHSKRKRDTATEAVDALPNPAKKPATASRVSARKDTDTARSSVAEVAAGVERSGSTRVTRGARGTNAGMEQEGRGKRPAWR